MSSDRHIPSAGPDFEHLLAQDVVIEGDSAGARTGAQRVEPDHSPRAPQSGAASMSGALPMLGRHAAGDLQREVEQFLYLQAELLDGKHWQAFIESYFATRQALRGLVVVMDIRHPLKDYDRQMLGYAVRRDLPAHVLLTKADKLSRGAAANTLQAVRMELSRAYGDTVSVQTFSGESKQGVEEARAVVGRWLEF